MNREDCVTFDVAKKLQDKEYDGDTETVVFDKERSNSDCTYYVPIPSLYDAQKWLREKGYHCFADVNCAHMWFAKVIRLSDNKEMLWDGKMYDTYEEALNASIMAGLKFIKDMKK